MDESRSIRLGRTGALIPTAAPSSFVLEHLSGFAASDARRAAGLDLERVCAWCESALARGWSSGAKPEHFAELRRLLLRTRGGIEGFPHTAPSSRAEARTGLGQAAANPGSPLAALAREHDLSATARDLLLAVAAYAIPEWAEVAQLYSLLGELLRVEHTCSEVLVYELCDGIWDRAAIAAELEPDAPLIADGLVRRGPGLRAFASLEVHPAVIQRLRGCTSIADPNVSIVLPGPRADVSDDERVELIEALREIAVVDLRAAVGDAGCLARLSALWRRPAALVDGDRMAPEQIVASLQHAWLLGLLPALHGSVEPQVGDALRSLRAPVFAWGPPVGAFGDQPLAIELGRT